jgi:hypothetical protein
MTPRGLRLIALLDRRIKDAALFERATASFCAAACEWVLREGLDGLEVDVGCSFDRARLLYSPRSVVGGITRRAGIVTAAENVMSLDALLNPAHSGSDEDDGPIPAGARNSTLTKIAGRMRARGADEQTIGERLLWVNRRRCSPPLDGREVTRIAKSVARYAVGTTAENPWTAAAGKSEERSPSGEKPDGSASNSPARISVGLDTDRVVREAITALGAARNAYSRGGMLSRIVRDATYRPIVRDEGATTIRTHTAATLDQELSTIARFERPGEKGPERCAPPGKVVRALLDAGAWPGVRPLVGVASGPILRPDGSVADAPGYDEPTGYFLAVDPTERVSIPESPTRADAIRERDEILAVVSDFPFLSEADRSAWLALLLTLLARSAIDGPCPLWSITANVRGAGKSRLVDIVALITAGHVASRATQPSDDAEAGKVVTSIVLAGDDLVLLDNVERPLGGSKLDALLTGARWKDRVLGGNAMIDLPVRVVLVATGNNIALRGDTHRRVLPVRLDSPHEQPELRTDFKVENILEHVRQKRRRLAASALTILRAWHVAGRPRASDVTMWGSYEAWTALVPQVLRFVDLPDPKQTRANLEGEDPHYRAFAVVLANWRSLETACGRMRGLTIHEALDHLYPHGQPAPERAFDNLRAALENLAPGRGPVRVDPRNLGHMFRRWSRRVLSSSRLVQCGTDEHVGVARWTVEGSAGNAGNAGKDPGEQESSGCSERNFQDGQQGV